MLARRSQHVHAIDDGRIECAGAELRDEQVGGRCLDDYIFAHAVVEAGGFQHAARHVAERALLGIAEADPEVRLREIGERLHATRVALFHDDADVRLSQNHGLGKHVRDGRDEAQVARIIRIRKFRIVRAAHRLHRGAEYAAAVEYCGHGHALAVGEFFQQALDRGPVHAAAVEDQLGLVGPHVAARGREAVRLKNSAALFRRSEPAREMQSGGGLRAEFRDARGGVLAPRGKFRHRDGLSLELRGDRVPHDRCVHGAELEIAGDVGDSRLHHGGMRGELRPCVAEHDAGDARDARGFGICKRELHVVAQQVGDAADVLWVARAHGDDGLLFREREDFADHAGLARVAHGAVVRGDEDVAHFRRAKLAEERAAAAILQLHLRTRLALILLRRGLDRHFQSRRAKHGEHRRARMRCVAVLPQRDAAEQRSEEDQSGGESFHGCLLNVNHEAALPSTSRTAAAMARSDSTQSAFSSRSQPGFMRFTSHEHAPRGKRHALSICSSPKPSAAHAPSARSRPKTSESHGPFAFSMYPFGPASIAVNACSAASWTDRPARQRSATRGKRGVFTVHGNCTVSRDCPPPSPTPALRLGMPTCF